MCGPENELAKLMAMAGHPSPPITYQMYVEMVPIWYLINKELIGMLPKPAGNMVGDIGFEPMTR